MSTVKHIHIDSINGSISSYTCDSNDRVINLDRKIRVKAPWTEKGWYEREVGESKVKSSSKSRKKPKSLIPKVLGGAVLGTAAIMGTGYAVSKMGEKKHKQSLEEANAARERYTEKVLEVVNKEVEESKKFNEGLEDINNKLQTEVNRISLEREFGLDPEENKRRAETEVNRQNLEKSLQNSAIPPASKIAKSIRENMPLPERMKSLDEADANLQKRRKDLEAEIKRQEKSADFMEKTGGVMSGNERGNIEVEKQKLKDLDEEERQLKSERAAVQKALDIFKKKEDE